MYSHESVGHVMAYALHHLINSGRHLLTYKEAMDKMRNHDWTTAWERYLDTWEDRDFYRRQIVLNKQTKKQNDDRAAGVAECVATKKEDRKRKHEEELLIESHEIEELENTALANQLRSMQQSDDISEILRERQRRELKRGSYVHELMADKVVNTEQFKGLRDVLVRADSALKHAKHRCLESAQSLHHEQIAVRDAIITVDRMSRVI